MQLGTATLVDALRAADRRDAIALVADDSPLTYGELVARIDGRLEELDLGSRSLVVLTGGNSLDWVVDYLALLAGGHVPLLAGDGVERLTSRWRPAALITAGT